MNKWVDNLLNRLFGRWYINEVGARSLRVNLGSNGFEEMADQIRGWKNGWEDGRSEAYKSYNPYMGTMNMHPSVIDMYTGTGYGCGFSEGAMYGRREINKNTFGGYRSLGYNRNNIRTICEVGYVGKIKKYYSVFDIGVLPCLLK